MSPQPSPQRGDQVRDVLVEAARTQLAAVTAATRFWAGWARVSDEYAQRIGEELARLEREGDSGDLVGRLTDLTREYVRSMSELPTLSVEHFNSQMEKTGAPKAGKRTRAARAKE